jgi:hypothetical protein
MRIPFKVPRRVFSAPGIPLGFSAPRLSFWQMKSEATIASAVVENVAPQTVVAAEDSVLGAAMKGAPAGILMGSFEGASTPVGMAGLPRPPCAAGRCR